LLGHGATVEEAKNDAARNWLSFWRSWETNVTEELRTDWAHYETLAGGPIPVDVETDEE